MGGWWFIEAGKRMKVFMMKSAVREYAGRAVLLLLALCVSVPAAALSIEDVRQRLAATEKGIVSCSLTIRSAIRNIGAGGREIQKIDREEQVWVHKPSKQVKRAVGNAEQTWDCAKGVTAKRLGGAVVERPYEYGLEVAIPYPLVYIACPAYILGQLAVEKVTENGAMAIVVGRPIGSRRGVGPYTEISVDMRRGSIDRIRLCDGSGKEIEDVRMEGWIRAGDCWMPRQVRRRAYGGRNVMVSRYTLSAAETNRVTVRAMSLQ